MSSGVEWCVFSCGSTEGRHRVRGVAAVVRRGGVGLGLGTGGVLSIASGSAPVVEAEVSSFPMCIDFLPDGRLLIVSSADRQVLRREPDGSLVTHADLGPVSTTPWNDIVVDGRGNAYVNTIGFDFPGGEFAPGIIVLVSRTARSAGWPTGWPSRTGWPSPPTARP